MSRNESSDGTIIDYITGHPKSDAGAERNRQQVERFLVETKGYDRKDIEVDTAIALDLDGERYDSTIDLVVCINLFRFMVIKCAAGSLASREREVLAAARLLDRHQIPVSVASDGRTAIVWDTVTGETMGEGLDAIPSKAKAMKTMTVAVPVPLEEKRRRRQKLIFRTYATRSCGPPA